MDEKNLLTLWNTQRSQIIHSQLTSGIVLVGILALATMGGFEGAPEKIQYLAIGIAAATGLLAIISQYAAIREGKAVTEDLKKIQDPSHLGQKVAESGALLSLTTLVTLGIGAIIYALVIYAVMG